MAPKIYDPKMECSIVQGYFFSKVSPTPCVIYFFMYFCREQKAHLHRMVKPPSNIKKHLRKCAIQLFLWLGSSLLLTLLDWETHFLYILSIFLRDFITMDLPTARLFYYVKLFYSIAVICYVKLRQLIYQLNFSKMNW